MDSKDFLETAARLLSNNPSEADRRSAASRAYYACYHLIRIDVKTQLSVALLQQSGLGGKLIDHGRLCMALKACSSTADLGTHLENLKRSRHLADYDLDRIFSHQRAADCVEDARALYQEVLAAGGPSFVAQSLRAHLQTVHGTI